MKTKKYAIFEHNLIFNKIKYQVGKRYKKDKFLFRTKDIRTLILDYLVTNDLTKQIEIRIIYDILNYNILKNINKNDYLELQPINDNLKEAFKIIGFKEINKILEENNVLYNEAIANLGYDKYLDYFTNNKKCLYSEILVSAILDKGRNKDLDLFINDCKELFIAEPIIYWQREKDLIKLSKSKNKEISWLANKELNEIEFI